MRQKTRIIILSAFLLAALLLCSCRARPYLNINCSDLPEGMELKLLVQIGEGDTNYRDNPKAGIFPVKYIGGEAVTELDSGPDSSCTDSFAEEKGPADEEKYAAFLEEVEAVGAKHLYNYKLDGWRSADYYMTGDTYTYGSSKFYFSGKYYRTRDFVCDYPNLRIAAVDGSGRVCRVSDIADMMPDDKFAVYTALDYSYESNALTPEDPDYRKINGKTPDHYLIWFWLLLAVGDLALIPLLVVMIAARNNGNDHRHIGFILLFILLSIGNILFTANYLMLELVPKFDLANDGFTQSDLKLLLFINALWIIEFIVFCATRSKPSKPNVPVDMNSSDPYNRRRF